MYKLIRLILLLPLLFLTASGCDFWDDAINYRTDLPSVLPTEYHAGRFVATPVTPTGDTLCFIADSGGGVTLIRQADAHRLGLSAIKHDSRDKKSALGSGLSFVNAPQFRRGASIPPPVHHDGHYLSVSKEWFTNRQKEELINAIFRGADGLLGQSWFIGRTFRFDYEEQQIVWVRDGSLPQVAPEHRIPMTPARGERGAPEIAHMVLPAVISGDTIPTLFDTGATVVLTESARRKIGGGPITRAGFHVSPNLYKKWRDEHPEWNYIENGSRGGTRGKFDLIRVPEVTVGGYEIGPVWLNTLRKLDRQDEFSAAIGGAALRYFDSVTVDFGAGTAAFEQ